MATGVGFAFGILGALTIGPFVLIVPTVAAIMFMRHPSARVGLPGLVSGIGFPLIYVAYLNRFGPGTVCRAVARGEECVDEWSPWPWLVVGVAVLIWGCAWFGARICRRHAPNPADEE
jgi:hypothetical protein